LKTENTFSIVSAFGRGAFGLVTANTVTVPVEIIDVSADDAHRTPDIFRTISLAASAINVTGDRDTRVIIRVAIFRKRRFKASVQQQSYSDDTRKHVSPRRNVYHKTSRALLPSGRKR